MNEEAKELLLNGLSVTEFLVDYAAFLAGALVLLIILIIRAIGVDPSTPNTFKWKYTLRGFLKFLIAMIFGPFIIIWFSDYGPLFLKGLFVFPGDDLSVDLNWGGAFLIGMGMDAIVHKVLKNKLKKVTP